MMKFKGNYTQRKKIINPTKLFLNGSKYYLLSKLSIIKLSQMSKIKLKIKRGLLAFQWKKWYFVTKIVLTYCEKKLGRGKLLKFEAKFLSSVEQFIQTVKVQNAFSTWSLMFLKLLWPNVRKNCSSD